MCINKIVYKTIKILNTLMLIYYIYICCFHDNCILQFKFICISIIPKLFSSLVLVIVKRAGVPQSREQLLIQIISLLVTMLMSLHIISLGKSTKSTTQNQAPDHMVNNIYFFLFREQLSSSYTVAEFVSLTLGHGQG